MPVILESKGRNLKSAKYIHDILGPTVTLDATKIGSQAHRVSQWWTNLVPPIVLQAAYDETQRPLYFFVQDILDPQRRPENVRWDDKPPYVVVNIASEPRRTFLIFVNFSKSYAFHEDGPCTILDTRGIEYMTEKPNVDEWE